MKTLNYISKTSSGMAVGLFCTLIVGTIIKQISELINFSIGIEVAKVLISLMGAGIGLGICLVNKEEQTTLSIVSCMALGALTSCLTLKAYNNPIPVFESFGGSKNPLLIYLVIIFTILITKKILKFKTPVDILLVPLTYIIIGLVIGFILIYPSFYIVFGIQKIIEIAMPMMPIIMSIIISVVVGMTLTMPISSVAICVAIDVGSTPLAAGACVIGCSVQMIGFAVMAYRSKNGIGKSISVGIGTSMLYWPNIIKKPVIWLPTIIASVILGPIGVCLLNTVCTSAGAGMGSCGLVGQIASLQQMGYSNVLSYVSIFGVQIFGSIILVVLLDILFKDILKLYSNEDLYLKI